MVSLANCGVAFFASSVDLLRADTQLASIRETHAQLGTEVLSQILHVKASDLQQRLTTLFEAFAIDSDSGNKSTHEWYYCQFHQVVHLLCTLIQGRTAAVSTDIVFESQLDVLLINLTTSLYCKVNGCSLGGERAVPDVAPDADADRKECARQLFNCVTNSSSGARARVAAMVLHVKNLKPAVPLSKGIYNPDSVCYAISTIQMLHALTGFRLSFLDTNFAFNPSISGTHVPYARSAAGVAQELQKVFALLTHSLLDYVDIDAFLGAFFSYQKARVPVQASTAGIASDDNDRSKGVEYNTVTSLSEDDAYGVETQSDAAAFLSELLHAVSVAYISSYGALDYCSEDKHQLRVHQYLQGFWFNVLERGDAARETDAGEGADTVHVNANANKHQRKQIVKKKEIFHALKLNVTSVHSQPSSAAAYTMDYAIERLFSAETVAQRWSPSAAGSTDADSTVTQQPPHTTIKRVEPSHWPPYLFVQPRRFGFDRERREKFKIRNTEAKFVFENHLDLSRFCGGKYSLVGVVIHSGTATDGHYYSFLKQPLGAGSEWALCDDDEVFACSYKRVVCEAASVPSPEDLLRLHLNEGEDEGDWTVDNETSAYLLVYGSDETACAGSGSEQGGRGSGLGAESALSEALQSVVCAANCEYCIDYLLGEL